MAQAKDFNEEIKGEEEKKDQPVYNSKIDQL
jgi:hypothetical protein